MIKRTFSTCIFLVFTFHFLLAQRAKDGSKTISTNNQIINEYAILTSDAAIGNTSINVDNNNLNANNRFSAALSQGDLVMIIQAQGATIFGNFFVDGTGTTFGTPKDSSWGEILNYNNAGNYEFAEVANIVGTNIIELNCALQNNYTAAGKVQIVRVPRLSNLTVNAAASITCDTWNGNKGGIVAIEVDGITVIDGAINTSGKGFRGGVIDAQASFGSNDVASTSSTFGGEKGESIAGFQNDYNGVGGRYCKGAPANGGGGGNMHNAGGGGGANGGDPADWIAVGNPSLATANWANAWNLEWPGLANATSSGGGKGGYTASVNNQNALTVGPNVGSWGGDNRNKQGGYGGRPLNYTPNKIFFGGGGGAADGNDGYTGAGGAAGGIIFLNCYGNIAGLGALISNGNNGNDASGNAPFIGIAGNDGAGGGGAGGTIFIQTTSTIAGISLIANGGNGGNQILTHGVSPLIVSEAEGPGGGGSGGYINTSVPITSTVNGGVNGTTNSPSLSEFPPNGATAGGLGTIINNLPSFDIAVSDVAICTGNTATLSVTISGTLPVGATITWYDAPFGGAVLATGLSFTTPTLTANTTYYVGFCPSTFTKPVNVNVSAGVSPAVAGNNQQICQNSTVLDANNPISGTGTWTIISGNGNFSDPHLFNATVTNLAVGINEFEWTISAPGCASSQSQVTITVSAPPTADAGTNIQLCNSSVNLAAIGAGTWSILTGNGNFSDINDPNTSVTNLAVGLNTFLWTVSVPGCSDAQDTVDVIVSAAVTAANAGSNQQLCDSTSVLSADIPLVGTGTWTVIAGTANFADINASNTTVTGLSLGSNVIEWTVSAPGCPSSTDQVIILVDAFLPVPFAGTDQTICTTNASISANPAPANFTGAWSCPNISTLFNNSNLNNTSVIDLNIGVNELVWTLSNPACPSISDTVLITVSSPLSIADAGTSQQICQTNSNLNAVAPSVGTGVWTLISGSGIINDVNNNNTTVTGLSIGNNLFEWTISGNGCPSNTDQITITVNNVITSANAGSDIAVCSNNTTLTGNTPTNGLTGTWSTSQVGVTFANVNDENTIVNNLQNGDNILIWTLSNTLGCPSTIDTVIIKSVTNPTTANAGTDNTICANNIVLNANTPSNGNGTWSIISGNGNIVNVNAANTAVNSLTTGDVIFVWTIENAPCPSNTDTVKITVLAPLSAANAGIDVSICDTQFNLNAVAPTAGTGVWTLISGTGNIANASNANTLVNNLSNGINTFQWTVSNGVCPDLSDLINITVSTPPSTAVADADIQTCIQAVQLNANTPQVGTGTWIIVQGNAAINSPNAPSSEATILSAGGATFVWEVSNGACPANKDSLRVILINGSNAANAGDDVTIALGDSTTLFGSGGTINIWEPPTGLSCFDCPNPIANPDTTTLYYVSVTDDNGCKSIDSVLVTVDETTNWFLPTAFTPDGNSTNDVLYFYGTGIKEFVLQVYDRWGEKVFETSEIKKGWDGLYKGKPALAGVYAYQLTITYKSTKVDQIKGNINLIRN